VPRQAERRTGENPLTLAIDSDETDAMETARDGVGIPLENLVYLGHVGALARYQGECL